eukprot:scaffold23434_cov135-Isochrysis_galbana.AAC.10
MIAHASLRTQFEDERLQPISRSTASAEGSAAGRSLTRSTRTPKTNEPSCDAIASRSGARRSMRFCSAPTNGTKRGPAGLERSARARRSAGASTASAMKARTASTRSSDGFANAAAQGGTPNNSSALPYTLVAWATPSEPELSQRTRRMVTRCTSSWAVLKAEGEQASCDASAAHSTCVRVALPVRATVSSRCEIRASRFSEPVLSRLSKNGIASTRPSALASFGRSVSSCSILETQ